MNRPAYPLVCFDLDGTLVDDTIYIWKTLHEGFRTDPKQRRQAFDNYFSGRISYKEWFDHDLRLLRAAGATRSSILRLLDGLRVMEGSIQTLMEFRRRGHVLAVISGSLDIVLSHLFPDFSFDHVLINRIRFHRDGRIAGGVHTPYDIEAKADGLRELCRREGISTSQAAFIGDNENDLWIAEAAGLAISFNSKSEKLDAIADHVITEKDLTRILPLLC